MSGETFTIYVIASQDEPFTQVTRTVRSGLNDYTAYRNAHGGVNGALLELQFADVDASGAGALSAFELFSAHQDALVILVLAPINQDLYDAINAQDFPVIYFGAGALPLETTTDEDHLFWLVPTPEQQLAVWLKYALQHWESLRPEGTFDAMRLNHISWVMAGDDMDRLEGIRYYLQQENIILTAEGQLIPSANASAANPILDGVFTQSTMLYLDLFSYGPAIVLNELDYLELEGFFTSAGGSWSLGVNLEPYLPNPEQVPSMYTPLPISWWSEAENPGIQTAEAIFEYSGRSEEERELGYLYALAAADLAASALETALSEYKKASDIELTPRDIYQALSQMESVDILDGLLTVDFREGVRTPQTLRIWQYSALEGLTPISDSLSLIELPE
jgi:hypothetical protein